jgi:hypothetical protein
VDFVKNLWRGEVSLGFTYWVVAVVGNGIFNIFDIYLDYMGYYDVITESKLVLIWIFISISAIYLLFSAVCVWRSANRYKGRTVLAVLAKLAVVLGLMRSLKEFLDLFAV